MGNRGNFCKKCGRNASAFWWKCCPTHCTPDGIDVMCQSCTEALHPTEPEFKMEL